MMRLVGYIKQLKDNSFVIPIYGDGKNFYWHLLDDNFVITGFETINSEIEFSNLYLSKIFNLGDIGAIVFTGVGNYISYGPANLIVNEIIFYLDKTTSQQTYIYIKREVSELQQILLCHEFLKQDIVNKKFFGTEFHKIIVNDPTVVEEFDTCVFLPGIRSRPFDNTEIYSLDKYLKIENSIFNSSYQKKVDLDFSFELDSHYLTTKLNIDETSKQVIIYLFNNYISNNKDFVYEFYKLELGKFYTEYLQKAKSPLSLPLEITIEESLRLRAEERRKVMKSFNYQFYNNCKFSDPFKYTMLIDCENQSVKDEEISDERSKFKSTI